jgi:hypothetical protein
MGTTVILDIPLTRTADFANHHYLNQLAEAWHDEPLASDSLDRPLLASSPSPRVTTAVHQTFAPLDTNRLNEKPLRDREATSFLMVPQAG